MNKNIKLIFLDRYNQVLNWFYSLTKQNQKFVKISFFILSIILLLYLFYSWYQYNRIVIYGNVDIRSVNVSFRVGGRISELLVEEGTFVEKNAILGSLDSTPYLYSFNQAQANYDAIKARNDLLLKGNRAEDIDQAKANFQSRLAAYNEAIANYNRQLQLFNSKVTNQQTLDSAKSILDQTKAARDLAQAQYKSILQGFRIEEIEESNATLRSAKSALDIAQLQYDDTVLKAPISGIIITRVSEPGTIISAGTPVFTLLIKHPIWIRAYVTEPQLENVPIGKKVIVLTDGGSRYGGRIGFVSPQAEFTPKSVETPDLRTSLVYRIRVIIDSPSEHLQQGMPVSIIINK
ncbi:MAG: efflux RND transporter periplasmic adaptor subunit [Methylacidiphilales bacterium]|nr:efflux RND transporter periplasmic adaptor subunit [Candidatus Methylacidiphilales bacterium]